MINTVSLDFLECLYVYVVDNVYVRIITDKTLAMTINNPFNKS